MAENLYPAEGIHLPPNTRLTKMIQEVSFGGAILVLSSGILILSITFLKILGFVQFADPLIINVPLGIALILSGISIFLQIKPHSIETQTLSQIIISILPGLAVFATGIFISSTWIFNIAGTNLFSINYITAITFLLTGLSSVICFIKIPHRYHFSQIFIIITLFITTFKLLDSIYRLPFINFASSDIKPSILVTAILIVLCQSILFTRPDRGFFGIFTVDSLSSALAQRFSLYIVFIPPIAGLIIIIGKNLGLYDVYSLLTITLTTLSFMSVLIVWLNTKFLYRSEQERFLMKEALRINNVHLEMNAENLTTKVEELKKAQKEAFDKINNKESLKNIVEETG